MQLENQCPMSIVYPDQYRIVWSTIIVWSCALVAGPKITALEVGRTFTVSDATSSIVVAIARVIAIAIARVVSIAKTWVVSVAIVVSRIVPLTSVVAGESAIAIIARISASRRPLSPSVVGRAAARLVVVVEATVVVVVAVVASVGKVAAGAAGATAALCKIPANNSSEEGEGHSHESQVEAKKWNFSSQESQRSRKLSLFLWTNG